jgi:hypothetical protein
MLVVARDPVTMGRHTNGWLAESLGWGYFVIIVVAAAAAIPLLVLTHGGKG